MTVAIIGMTERFRSIEIIGVAGDGRNHLAAAPAHHSRARRRGCGQELLLPLPGCAASGRRRAARHRRRGCRAEDRGSAGDVTLGYAEGTAKQWTAAAEAFYFVGSTGPVGRMLPLIAGTAHLVNAADAAFVIVETTGHIEASGRVLKGYKMWRGFRTGFRSGRLRGGPPARRADYHCELLPVVAHERGILQERHCPRH
jgi:hypothetical protein